MTIVNWEKGRTQPSIRQLPKFFTFLGYVPFGCPPDALGQLRYYELIHGLSYEDLAQELEMDESMVMSWFAGRHRPSPRSLEWLEAFLHTKGISSPST